MSSSSNVSSSAPCITGRVKWFNNKAGYGFITSTDGEQAGTDVFVHHTAVMVSNQQYKYLVQGEYVEFKLNPMENGTHKFQAIDVRGIKGGLLMCETRRVFRDTRVKPSDAEETAEPMKRTRQVNARGSGPREGTSFHMSGRDSSAPRQTRTSNKQSER